MTLRLLRHPELTGTECGGGGAQERREVGTTRCTEGRFLAFKNALKLQCPPAGGFSPTDQTQLPPCSPPPHRGPRGAAASARRARRPLRPQAGGPGRGSPRAAPHPEAPGAQAGRDVAPGCSCSRSNLPPVPDSCNCRRGPGGPPGFPPPAASAAPPSSHPPPPREDRGGSGESSAKETQGCERSRGDAGHGTSGGARSPARRTGEGAAGTGAGREPADSEVGHRGDGRRGARTRAPLPPPPGARKRFPPSAAPPAPPPLAAFPSDGGCGAGMRAGGRRAVNPSAPAGCTAREVPRPAFVSLAWERYLAPPCSRRRRPRLSSALFPTWGRTPWPLA